MSHIVQWYVPGRVYMVQSWGDISMEELREISAKVVELVRSGQAPVHCIADTRYLKNAPKHLNELQKVTVVVQEPNLGWFLALTNNQFVDFAMTVITQSAHIKQHTFHDPVEMIQSLQRLDLTLPELPPYIFEPPELEA